MMFGQEKKDDVLGERVGFVCGYMVFTIVLFFVLDFFGRLPASWVFAHVALLTFIITLFGLVVKVVLGGKNDFASFFSRG